MRTAVLILTVVAVAALAAEPQLLPVVPVPAVHDMAAAVTPLPLMSSPTAPVDPAALWRPMVRMSPQERANAQLTITANSREVREIEAMWNRGQYDAAIAALQQWAEGADLRRVCVGFNWRVPIQSSAADWGINVRVGTRDSAYRVCLDRDNTTGNLLVTSICFAGDNTDLVADLSTDGGSTWTETYSGGWIGASAVNDMEMTGSGGFEYVTILFSTIPDSAYCYRFNAATGAAVRMPDSTNGNMVLKTSVANDTIEEVAFCDWDDEHAAGDLYLLGGTAKHMIEAGYSGNNGLNWSPYTAVADFYYGGLDYCYNHYDSLGTDRYVFFSCLTKSGGNLYPGCGYYTNDWHTLYIDLPTQALGSTQTTGITAWHDTIFLIYPHQTATGTAIRCCVSSDTGNHWYATDLTDSSATRENADICGRLGAGVGAVWRDYAGGGRWLGYRFSGYGNGGWTALDTVNDHKPSAADRPRVQLVAPGVHGVCYISSDVGSLWFNRDDWSGIAGPRPERIVPLGLVAALRRGGARLSFTNPIAGPVTLKVYDASGRRVLSRTQQLRPGAQTLDCAVPASGSYIAILKTAAATATTKFSTMK